VCTPSLAVLQLRFDVATTQACELSFDRWQIFTKMDDTVANGGNGNQIWDAADGIYATDLGETCYDLTFISTDLSGGSDYHPPLGWCASYTQLKELHLDAAGELDADWNTFDPHQTDSTTGTLRDCCKCFWFDRSEVNTDKPIAGFACEEGEFINGGPKTYQWVIGPLLLYIAERIYRLYKSKTRVMKVLRVIRHNDAVPVMEVQITKVPTKAGQYAFLHCPKVSGLEWHPFTLTSSPELDYISFHIRLVGDWTCAFAEECGFYDAEPKLDLPNVAIDGPFGTASEDIYKYEVGVCICAGIGVTPFASLLRELKAKQASGEPMRLKHVYFYWICAGFDSWGWFSNLLVDFEHQCHDAGVPDFLTIKIHMSRGWSKDDAEKLYLHSEDEGEGLVKDDQGRCLKSKMNFGRPNWTVEFMNMAMKDHSGKKIGVFFCGPKVLGSQLHENCNKFSDNTTQFFFNKENF
jgi:hypothetical protein